MAESLIISSQLVELVAKIENRLDRGIRCAMDVGGQVELGGIDLPLNDTVLIDCLRVESEVAPKVENGSGWIHLVRKINDSEFIMCE